MRSTPSVLGQRELAARPAAGRGGEHLVAARPAGDAGDDLGRGAQVGPHDRAQRPAEVGSTAPSTAGGLVTVPLYPRNNSRLSTTDRLPTEHLCVQHTEETSMSLFRLDSSIRGEGSVSREVADTVQARLRRAAPDGPSSAATWRPEPSPRTPGHRRPRRVHPARTRTAAQRAARRPRRRARRRAARRRRRRDRHAALQLRRLPAPQDLDRPARSPTRASAPAPARWPAGR